MKHKRALRVVVVSPSDVEEDIESLKVAISEINHNLGLAGFDVFLEVNRWTDVHPGFHPKGTQAWIDSVLKPQEADILIGVFWKRLGSAGAGGSSGTEHEIKLAREAAAKTGKPHIMLYFRGEPYDPKGKEETDQWGKVLALKAELGSEALYSEYKSRDFMFQAFRDLFGYVLQAYPPTPTPEISVMSIPKVVRAEGLTEAVGEIHLDFKGYSPGMYDIRLFLNVSITNCLSSSDNLTDACLSIWERSFRTYGQSSSVNSLLFSRVPVESSRLFARITNVRANANALGVNHSNIDSIAIVAWLSIQPSSAASATEIEPIGRGTIVGYMKKGCAFRMFGPDLRPISAIVASRRNGLNGEMLEGSPTGNTPFTFYVQFTELLPFFFKTSVEEGTERGTRFCVFFGGVQKNVHVFITTVEMPLVADVGNSRAVLVSPQIDAASSGLRKVEGGLPVAEVPIAEDHGAVAVWEWVSKDDESARKLDDIVFGVVIAAIPGEALLGTMIVRGCLGPTSVCTTPSQTEPIPRFADVSMWVNAVSFTL